MTVTAPVKTGSVADRRKLHFNSLNDALADAEMLVGAERAGRLRQLGNWTLGQALGHLAGWIDYCFDGVPLKMSWVVRFIMRRLKKQILYKPMRAGSSIPGVKGGTIANEPLTLEEGIGRFRKAVARLNGQTPALPHLAFGAMTREEWLALHLRHAELHLSFFRVD